MSVNERETLVRGMIASLQHRGPDESCVAAFGDATLGTARLAIVDVSGGSQPLGSGQRAIAYNGEIYNHEALRSELETRRIRFRSRCDVEVALHAEAHWGDDAPVRFDGMFAYALWDTHGHRLRLVRDRLGIKPLYYVDGDGWIAFASEPKALLLLPRVDARPDRRTIGEYFLHGSAFAAGYATGRRSFYESICAVAPAEVVTWTPSGRAESRYWSVLSDLGEAPPNQDAATTEVAAALRRSVRSMLMGEARVGTALSGGLDSSLLTALATEELPSGLTSACITFREDHADPDAAHATAVSRFLKGKGYAHDLRFTHLSEDGYLDDLPSLVRHFDEPHWEPRQLGMFANYRTLARTGSRVVLTGEGADELFFGYYWKFPGFRTGGMGGPEELRSNWSRRASWIAPLIAPCVSKRDLDELLDAAVEEFYLPAWAATRDPLRAAQCWYSQTFLPWLLLDNDRSSMAHGVEGRFPFLSNELIRLALRMPPEWNLAGSPPTEKRVLREMGSTLLPPEVWRDRRKAPLPVPEAKSHHLKIAEALRERVRDRRRPVWDLLDRSVATSLLEEFERSSHLVGAMDASDGLAGYVPLMEPPRVRTAHLFAILTCIEWCDQNFGE